MAWRILVCFFSVVLNRSMHISAFRPNLSPFKYFVILFILLAFSLCFFVIIFKPKIIQFLLHPVVCMFLRHVLPDVVRIFFRCFGMSFFVCIVLPFVDISLIFLLSLGLSGLFLQVVLFFFLVLSFPFCLYMFLRLSFILSFCPVFIAFFLSAFPVEFRILVLIFFFFWCFLRGSLFSHKLISPSKD